MRRTAFVLAVLVIGLGVVSRRPACAASAQLAHAIFLKVNGQTITQEQVVETVKYIIKREYNNVMPEDEQELENIQEAAQRDLVRSLLIHDEAAKNDISVDSNRLKYVISASGLKQDEITPAIRRLLEADELFSDIMMNTGTPIREPSPREIKEFYIKNKDEFTTNAMIIVRTIFIATDDTRPQAFYKEQGEELMRRLEAVPPAQRTEAFAKAAEETSQDVFAKFGGLLTGGGAERWIPKDFNNQNADGSPIFPPTMVEEIKRLNHPGDIRLAVSADGIHLLYCEDVRGGRTVPWSEANDIIEFILKERYKNRHLRIWLNQVYDRSDVRWHDGAVYEKENLTRILLPSERGTLTE